MGKQWIWGLGVMALVLSVGGCASKEKRSGKDGYVEGEERELLKDKLSAVYFDFDRSELRLDAQNALSKHVAYFKDNADSKAQVEGHCDERGTVEYNLALGERRALSVRQYLEANGVNASRVTFVSYGEEKPADSRSTEEAWAVNRRAEFVLYR